MRITCCIHSLSGGGAEHLMATLASRLAARGHQVTLLTLDHAEADHYPVAPEVQRVALGVMGTSRGMLEGARNNRRRVQAVRQALRDHPADVVLSYCDQMNVVVLLAARPLGLPVVVAELTDPRFHPLPRIWRLLRRWLYPQAAAVVAVSRASAAEVSRLTGRGADVILNAVDLPEGLSKTENRGGATEGTRDSSEDGPIARLVTVGRLAEEKRQSLLIDAFDRLADRYPQWRLEIAGSGPLQAELQARIDRSEARQRIELCGRVFPIWPFLQRAEAFALTSRYEGTPVALLEAMAAGCACVAIDNDSGAGELIRDGHDGLLAADSLDGLTAALDRLLGDPPLRRRLAEAAQASAAQHNWDRCTDAYEQVLQRALAAARPSDKGSVKA